METLQLMLICMKLGTKIKINTQCQKQMLFRQLLYFGSFSFLQNLTFDEKLCQESETLQLMLTCMKLGTKIKHNLKMNK